jgi:hypothetical protein
MNPFLSFYTHLKKKGHNMLASMLDPKFKSMGLITTYVVCDNVVALIATYDNELLLPLLPELYKLPMSTILEEANKTNPNMGNKKLVCTTNTTIDISNLEGPCWLKVVHLSLISY